MAEVLTALGFVAKKLDTFLSEEGKLLGGLRQEVQLISDEFGLMKAFMEVVESNKEDDPRLAEWIKQLREAAYDTEDVLDQFTLLFAPRRSHGFKGFVGRNFNTIKNLPARHRLATRLQSLKVRIKNISEARLRYDAHYDVFPAQVPGHLTASSAWSHSDNNDALLVEEAQLVGINRPKQDLISQILEGDSQLKVITVIGMGGMGKTTLVKTVYDDPDVKRHFQVCAWVTVSQSPDFQAILQGLILHLQAQFKKPVLPPMESMDIRQLKALVKDFLQQARYVIVFDDVSDRDFWDAFQFVVPENTSGGNRVILTTRNLDLASSSRTHNHHFIYRMNFLSFQESWTLFCRKTFEGNRCPAHLVNVVQSIVRKCEGLPLAIVLISRLLGSKRLSRTDEWELIRRRLGDELEGTGRLDRVMKIIDLSYNDLPSTLRTCLLYTSMYPEDYKISCRHLIQLWIAERFVEHRAGFTAEEVAGDYIKELAGKSFIQVSEVDCDGSPLFFHIHDILRDFILSKSSELNMITPVGTTLQTRTRWPPEKRVRGLAFHKSFLDDTALESHHYFKNLRTLITIQCTEPQPKALLTKLLSSELLKILDLGGVVHLEEIPKEIFKLFHLTHLSLAGTGVKVVPKSIKRLKNLEYLDLSETKVRELPMEIRKLKKLRHLCVYQQASSSDGDLGCHGFKAPCKMGGLGELQRLESLDNIDAAATDKRRIINEIEKLTQLRKLGVTNVRTDDGKELLCSLEKLTNLRELEVASSVASSVDKDDVVLDLNHTFSAPSLQSVRWLSLRSRLKEMPPWISNLERLVAINLTWSSLNDDPLESLKNLPNLVEVVLIKAYEGMSLRFNARGFLKLKKLYLRDMKGLREIKVEDGAMPNIKQLTLHQLPLLQELPSGIKHLSQLQELELWDLRSELRKKIENEALEECGDYRNIAHIPQVIIGFKIDGEWRRRKLFRKKKTFDTLLFAFAVQVASVPLIAEAATRCSLPSPLIAAFVFGFLYLTLFYAGKGRATMRTMPMY